MHIKEFPQETQDFIHRLCAKAILRAIKNGTYKPLAPAAKVESGKGDS